MLADSAYCPWQNDVFLGKDHNYNKLSRSSSDNALNRNLPVDAGRERVRKEKRRGSSTTPAGASCCTSVASSSEFSDDVWIDLPTDFDSQLVAVSEDSDYLSSSVLNIFDQEIGSDHTFLDTFDWVQSDFSITSTDSMLNAYLNSDVVPSIPSSPQAVRKRSHSENATCTEHKTWSQMTSSEQLSQVEELTRIVSNEMGLREQLEIIRIINPHAQVSPTDTEFVIDLDCLSEEKLQQVRVYIQKHRRSSSTLSDSCSECSASPSQKKLNKKQRRTQMKELRQRQRKEHRQMMKEKRSGLFDQEEVLSLTSSIVDDGSIDVDVLG